MKNFITNHDYDKAIESLIPTLDNFSYLQGSEGRVYFIDDNFVIKSYFQPESDLQSFEEYFKEIKSFSESGLAVPKVYSWTAIQRNHGKFKLYVLEERVKGSTLFDRKLSSVFSRCKDFCSENEFELAIGKWGNNKELFGMIVREFIKSYIERNENLFLMSDENLENFIRSDYEIGMKSRYSFPDVQSENVIFDDEKLTIIDCAYLQTPMQHDEQTIKTMLIRDMVSLFHYNESIQECSAFVCGISPELKKLKIANRDICFEAMRRFVRKTNEMYQPKINNKFDFDVCQMVANQILGKKLADEISSEIQRDF